MYRRGLTPPHRIKSISMATFTQEEIDFLKAHGNEECAKTWLGLWDAKRAIKQDHRDFMIDKYERKRYYLEPASPLMSIPSGRQLTANNNTNSNSIQQKSEVDNLAVLKSINLTPPSSLRLNKPPSASSRHNTNHLSESNSSAHGSPLFKTVGPRAINGHRLNNTSSGTASNSSTGSDATNHSANKFTPDTDFVADFSKIDMFNETVPSTNGNNTKHLSNNNNSSSVVSSNNNRNGFVMLNGGDNNNCKVDNATKNLTGGTGVMENFADFEHNQIYNAAGKSRTFCFFFTLCLKEIWIKLGNFIQ